MTYDGAVICAVPPDALALAEAGVCKWPGGDVTWAVESHPSRLSFEDARDAYALAWGWWARVCGLRPRYTTNPRTANVLMGAGRIDGPSGTLAWSELPCGGAAQLRQRYDDAERWVVSETPAAGEIDLARVACHEVGHAVGIGHIGPGNLLAPTYSSRVRKPQAGDIEEAVRRYGPPREAPPEAPPPAAAEITVTVRFENGRPVVSIPGYRVTPLLTGGE